MKRLDAWRRAAEPALANDVLLGLARLAAFDGADDRDAALVLAWLLLPTALRVRRRLGLADDRVDEVLAAQLCGEPLPVPLSQTRALAPQRPQAARSAPV